MAPKSRRRAGNPTTQHFPQVYNFEQPEQPTYIEYSDNPSTQPQFYPQPITTPPTRTLPPSELNLSVLKRHNPQITSILAIAQYVVLYTFSPLSSNWEKCNIEGSLFVVSLRNPAHPPSAPPPPARYGVLVLNRRGLDNFDVELRSADDVEITDEYIILTGADAAETNNEDGSPTIYGIWVFQEAPPSSTAGKREEIGRWVAGCAGEAERARVEWEVRHRSSSAAADFDRQQSMDYYGHSGHGTSLMNLLSPGVGETRGWNSLAGQEDPYTAHQQQHYGLSGNGQDVLNGLFERARLGQRSLM